MPGSPAFVGGDLELGVDINDSVSGYIRLSFAEGKIIKILYLVGVAVDLQRTSIPITGY